MADTIYSVLPNDRTLCLDDVRGLVASAEPNRERSKATIRTNLNRLFHAGSIKRIRHAKAGKTALFALIDYDVREARTMLDWARDVDGWREMSAVELMVKIVESGYEMEVSPKDAVRSLLKQLKG